MSDPRKILLDLQDELVDPLEEALRRLCKEMGHEYIDDHCGNPAHRFCCWCRDAENKEPGSGVG